MERRSLGSRLLEFANAYYAGSKTSIWAELYNHVLLAQLFSAKNSQLSLSLSLYPLQWWKYHRHWDLSKSKQKKKKKERKHKSVGLKGWISIQCCSQGDTEWITHPLPILFTTQWARSNHNHKQQKKNHISLSHSSEHASEHVSCLLSKWVLFLNDFLVQSCAHVYVHGTLSKLKASWLSDAQMNGLKNITWWFRTDIEPHFPPT